MTNEDPVQSFQWGDYTTKPGTTYQYRVVPTYGQPKLIALDLHSSVLVEITTQKEQGKSTSAGVAHDVYFNRGAAGSQAYARKFGATKPDQDQPDSDQMKWLSRGLFEASKSFIAVASGPDADDYKLRATFYEFRYLPARKAFAVANKAGADVALGTKPKHTKTTKR